jgi:NAD-dependent SIR2 family protein deacetylase
MVEERFFRETPEKFWFVYGDLYQRYKRAKPHLGHIKLRDIIWRAGKEDKYWVYHSGVDKFYLQQDFDPSRYTQAKGSLMDWQCKSCNLFYDDVGFNFDFLLNRIAGAAMNLPKCR